MAPSRLTDSTALISLNDTSSSAIMIKLTHVKSDGAKFDAKVLQLASKILRPCRPRYKIKQSAFSNANGVKEDLEICKKGESVKKI